VEKGSGTFKVTRWADVDTSAPIIRLGELFTVKRSGTHKFRQYARRDMMGGGVGTALCMKFRGGDVMCAYLQGRQRTKLYCYPPSYARLVELGEQELSDVRRTLRKIVDKHGKKIIK